MSGTSMSYDDVHRLTWYLQIIHFSSVSGLVLLAYDYVITLDMEVQLIWASRWNVVKFLFLLSRYMPFVDAACLIVYMTIYQPETASCTSLYHFLGWWGLVGIAIVEVLLTIRIWAVWNQSQNVLFILAALFVVIWAGICVSMSQFLMEIRFSQIWTSYNGCLNVGANSALSMCWILVGAYDFVILVLLAIRALPALRQGKAYRISMILYTDGLIYYIYLFALSLVNAIVILSLPPHFVNLFTMLERVMYSILTCRAILHVRVQKELQENGDVSILIEEITSQWARIWEEVGGKGWQGPGVSTVADGRV